MHNKQQQQQQQKLKNSVMFGKYCKLDNVLKSVYNVAPLQNARQRSKALTAQWPRVQSIGQILKPFTGNGDVSIRVKIFSSVLKNPKQNNNALMYF